MKYSYAYKTSDGVRHEAWVEASCREEVFALLRAKGIRAIKVVAADGSKANGEVRGVRKRVFLTSLVIAVVVVGAGAFYIGREDRRLDSSDTAIAGVTKIAVALPRQEIAGDRKRLLGLSDSLFSFKAERFLAKFAEPGIAVPASELPSPEDFMACLDGQIRYAEGELTEVIDLKRMVVGLKEELAAYVKGGGSVGQYVQELIKRQNIEVERKESARRHLNELLSDDGEMALQSAYDYYLKANAQLHAMGIAPLPMPYELQSYQKSVLP